MKTGPRSPILLNEEESKIELPNGTIVNTHVHFACLVAAIDYKAGKKLKKRLEDLERRANSTSASPEPEPRQDDDQDSDRRSTSRARRSPSLVRAGRNYGFPELSYDRVSPSCDEKAKSPYYYARQPSTPPQFSHSTYPIPESRSYASHQQAVTYQFQPMSPPELPMYGTYLSPGITAARQGETPPIKSEYFDEDFKSFSMTYAPATGSSMSSTQGYFDSKLNVMQPHHRR